jgi:PAS domain S-box-containing protein
MPAMSQPLKVLIAEDNPDDAELLLRALRRSGFEPEWKGVESEPDFQASLHAGLDLVISDYEMPQFSGLRALECLKQSGLTIPFIIVSGTIGEETAVEAMRLGASDYLMKDRLARLGPAVTHALTESRLRRERREADEALRQANERTESLLASMADIHIIYDRQWRYVRANAAALKSISATAGVPPDRILGRTLWEVFPLIVGTEIDRQYHRAMDERIAVSFEFFYAPAEAWWHNRFYPTADGVAVFATNITESKRATEALRESEERFRQMAESIEEVFWMQDVTTDQIIYVSPAYENVWGRKCAELYADPRSWMESVRPEDRGRVLQAVTTKLPKGEYDETYQILRPDGAMRWIRDRAFPVKTADGSVRRVVGVAEDITERMKLEEQFLHAQRMEAVGTLASGVAHDLNNILAPMMMVAGLLKMRSGGSDKDREMLSMIERSGQRGADVIRQLLTFARSVPGERGIVQPKHLARDMAGIMRETFPRNIAIEESVPTDLWTVEADPTQLHQVIMNLCVNARDAMPAGGSLALEAANEVVTTDLPAGLKIEPGRYVRISVRDTGQGIAPEIIGRIFEPFFTTKAVGKGTGLGLSTVIGIVKGHGGVVRVQSEPGQGTTFDVFLPASDEKVAETSAGRVTPAAIGNGELILIVDDEESIRDTTRKLLEKQGYRVVVADSGEEAIKMCIQHQGALRLVLTDIMMAGMDGLALIRVLRILAPSLPIIVASGLSQDRAELSALGVTAVLAKPFALAEILEAVQSSLAAKTRGS